MPDRPSPPFKDRELNKMWQWFQEFSNDPDLISQPFLESDNDVLRENFRILFQRLLYKENLIDKLRNQLARMRKAQKEKLIGDIEHECRSRKCKS